MSDEIEIAVRPQVEELESVVERMVEVYERLGAFARERHEGVRRADPDCIGALVERERHIAQEAAELEQQRARLVRDLVQRLGVGAGQSPTIRWIAERVGGESGERLQRRAEELRERLEAVKKENDVVRRALVHLAAHMEGLWRQASSMLNHARTYGRTGSVEPGPRVVSCLDLSS